MYGATGAICFTHAALPIKKLPPIIPPWWLRWWLTTCKKQSILSIFCPVEGLFSEWKSSSGHRKLWPPTLTLSPSHPPPCHIPDQSPFFILRLIGLLLKHIHSLLIMLVLICLNYVIKIWLQSVNIMKVKLKWISLSNGFSSSGGWLLPCCPWSHAECLHVYLIYISYMNLYLMYELCVKCTDHDSTFKLTQTLKSQ